MISLKYRSDIDGLRAISVLGVVLFHAFPKLLKGGYAGVDVFFVISGYLITTIIYTNFSNGIFSFFEFYSHRIRRIFPSLIVVLIFVFIVGVFFLLSEELVLLGIHIFSGSAFISNFMFWSENGYFDQSSELKPLLHLWSLSIEEQFYIVWPFIIFITLRIRRFLPIILIILLSGSFFYNIIIYKIDRIADFYSPISRFWELLAGSLLALVLFDKKSILNKLHTERFRYKVVFFNTISIVGFIFILFSFVFFSKKLFFPGYFALLPVAGAVLIIFSGQDAVVNKFLLSNRFLVWIGLLSYPLYIWHWPIIALYNIYDGETASALSRLLAIFISFILALLTYRFIERPLRFGGRPLLKTYGLVAAMAVLGCAGYATFYFDGFPARPINSKGGILAGELGHRPFFLDLERRFFPCRDQEILKSAPIFDGRPRCFQSKNVDQIDAVVFGDSHAEHLFPGLADKLSDRNVAYFIGAGIPSPNDNNFIVFFDKLTHDRNIKYVFIAGYWSYRILQSNGPFLLQEKLSQSLRTITNSGKIVYLIDDIPNFPFQPTRCKARRAASLHDACSMPSRYFFDLRYRAFVILDSVVSSIKNSNFINISDKFCSDDYCFMQEFGTLFYRDDNHLTIEGSRKAADIIVTKAGLLPLPASPDPPASRGGGRRP